MGEYLAVGCTCEDVEGARMGKVAWIALGAVGGILVYRGGQRFIADARERGVVASSQQVGATAWSRAQAAAGLLATARELAAKAVIAQAAASQALAQQGQTPDQRWPNGPVGSPNGPVGSPNGTVDAVRPTRQGGIH